MIYKIRQFEPEQQDEVVEFFLQQEGDSSLNLKVSKKNGDDELFICEIDPKRGLVLVKGLDGGSGKRLSLPADKNGRIKVCNF